MQKNEQTKICVNEKMTRRKNMYNKKLAYKKYVDEKMEGQKSENEKMHNKKNGMNENIPMYTKKRTDGKFCDRIGMYMHRQKNA